MKRLATLALILVALPAWAGPEHSVHIVYQQLKRDDKGTLRLHVGMGTGTVVKSKGGRSLVLTCRHVCPDGDGFIFVVVGEAKYAAEFIAADERADLAVLRVRVELPAAEVAAAAPGEADELRQWGHERAGRAKEKKGRRGPIRDGLDIDGDRFDGLYLSRIPAEPGDSGAGVFDKDGWLVGVCMAKGRDDVGPIGLLVGLDRIRAFLAGRAP
jgi:hypothetical protein